MKKFFEGTKIEIPTLDVLIQKLAQEHKLGGELVSQVLRIDEELGQKDKGWWKEFQGALEMMGAERKAVGRLLDQLEGRKRATGI